ncbi:MAG: CHASE2 domain-containing protein [Leptolyngbya sp. RL_3_1]|nr:CHASE2 domain-containing protein [Leptolyngbya sp. RL_3_1]
MSLGPHRSDRFTLLLRRVTMSSAPITLVFTDLVASTEVKNHLPGSDVTARNQHYLTHILNPHRQRVEDSLPAYGGWVVNTEGDGYFLGFDDAIMAAKWAIALQLSHVQDPIPTPLGGLQVKIALHTGSPLQDGNDYIGQEVDYAARLVGLGEGERTLLSEMTAVLVRNAQIKGFELYFQGEYTLRGLGSVPVYELVYRQGEIQVPQRGPIGYERARQAAARRRRQWLYGGISTLLTAALIIGLQLLGVLQPFELKALDVFMRLRPPESADSRVLVVRVTEADFQALGEYPLSDRTVLQLLQTLNAHQPRLIGLDLYRDIPQGEGHGDLTDYWRQHPEVYGVCKMSSLGDVGIAPPTLAPAEQMGFADVVVDNDQVLRRQLLVQTPPPASPCTAAYSLSALLALHYLNDAGKTIAFTEADDLVLDGRRVPRLTAHSGGYHRFDATGYQMVLNYRLPIEAIPQVTAQAVLTGEVHPEDIRDRIVLIGVDQEGTDRHFTPDSFAQRVDQSVAGVIVQAQMVSHLVSGVLEGRPWIRPLPVWGNSLWVTAWTGISLLLLGLGRGKDRRLWGPKLLGIAVVLCGSSLILLVLGLWVPVVPTAIAIMLASAGMLTLPSLDPWNDESI